VIGVPRRAQLFLAPVTAGVLVLAVILTLNWLLLPRDRAVYRERAAEAIAGQVLAQRSYLPFTEAQPPRYGQNDCLILAMLATEPPGTRWQAAVSPVHPVVQVPEGYRSVGYDALRRGAATPVPKTELCWQLLVALQPPSRQVAFYHHYVHGYLTGTAALLKVMSLKQASALLHGLAVALPALVLLMALGDGKDRQGRRAVFASVRVGLIGLKGA
jgi:hypothetical protein